MLHEDSIVMVRPIYSLRFAKWWGRVVKIDTNDGLPVKVKFNNSDVIYGFTANELMTGKEVKEWDKYSNMNRCYKCGADLTGQYTIICEECSFPLPEED
jgi:heme/copper-type cytochrome/quinol oxidase subunit 2